MGTTTFSVNMPDELARSIDKYAEDAGLSRAEFIRLLLAREMRTRTPASLYEPILAWWEKVMHQDPSILVGVKARAQGAGQSFDHRFMQAIRTMYENSML